MTTHALEGLRILDMTQVAVGPYTTLLPGFMGAEVIKVESCSRMDISRGQARPSSNSAGLYPQGEIGERPWDRTGHYIHRNGNKLSLTLDLAAPRGKALLLQLAAKCDVLVENYRASVMDRLGLGYEAISQVNPRLIYVKISSQGATGPEKDYGSLGSTLEQTAGLASITGYEDGIPLMTNETFPDPVVGMLAVGALMAALRQRRQTGRGTFIDLAQREVTAAMLGEHILAHGATGNVPGPTGNRHPHMAPQGVYLCRGEDMWVSISVGNDTQWQALCEAMGQPQLAQDTRFATLPARHAHASDLDAILSAWTQERDHYDVMHLLQSHGVPAGAVLKGSETIADPHLHARGFWDEVHHPESGPYQQVTTPWQLSKSPRRTTTPAPSLGAHNGYVLGEILGLSEQEIHALAQEGIIGTRPIGADA
ncbi:CaiB/BaiF CoA transferase family protein [Candidatus Entotheonella palauensis]|uniref:CaiB/BaiF CoA transferase family protein n=1 Tax=Candidatus Entotheonella palauensis TaxID=93172 RepID=UPI000B7DE028|nr:CoA transferase [Candidatus Entotheonella palauensis]